MHSPPARPDAEKWVSGLWRDYSGGAWRVEARELRTAAGTIAYLSLHHRKISQGPPAGWRGKRLLTGQGYFSRPVGELRQEARELLLNRRLRWAAELAVEGASEGWPEDVLDDYLAAAVERARVERAANPPQLVRVREREQVDQTTGEVSRQVVEVVGPMQARSRAKDAA